LVPIWDDAQAIYGAPGFAAAALRLQDEHGADACVLIWLLWRGRQGRGANAAELAPVLDAVAAWRVSVIEPLRAARRAMKPVAAAAALRARVQGLELEAERLHLERLAGFDPAGTPAESLGAYAALIGTVFPPDLLAILTDASV
jgi:uncharacterized protein (TIGR02444 family)